MNRSELVQFWERTRHAWANGEVSTFFTTAQDFARRTAPGKFIIDSPGIAQALDTLRPRTDEVYYCYCPVNECYCDMLLTNRRLVVWNARTGAHDIYELLDVAAYVDYGSWTKSITIKLHDGTSHRYTGLRGGMCLGSEIVLLAITKACEAHNSRHASRAQSQKKHMESDESIPRTETECARILGLKGRITREDVKARWRILSKQYHPDNVQHLGPKLRELAENEMKRINIAYAYFQKKYNI